MRYCRETRWCTVRLALKDSFYEFTKTKTVNGMWLLQKTQLNGFYRYCWSTVLIMLFVLGSFLSLELWIKFYSYPIINTIATDVTISQVDFPGITVCSPKVVNWEKVQKFVKTLYIPKEYDVEEVVSGFDYLNAFTDQLWVPPNSTSFEVVDAVLELNNITIMQAAKEVSAGCDDFFQYCYWDNENFPCNQEHEYLQLTRSTSYMGPCCSFNYNPNNESFLPFASNIFGMNCGISFIGLEGSEKNVSTGLVLLIHHPMDFATEAAASVTIKSNSESFVEIFPTVHSSSENVLELTVDKRNCLTSDDVELLFYREAQCMLSCQNEAIFKICGCHPYHLPTTKKEFQKKECKLKDALCYTANYDIFKNLKCEQCYPNCYDITYETSSYNTDLQLHNFSVNSIYTSHQLTENSFIVRIFLGRQVVPSNRKVAVMSWISLLADLGGVFSLCLGLSLVSIVECLYFFTYRFYFNYVSRSTIINIRANAF